MKGEREKYGFYRAPVGEFSAALAGFHRMINEHKSRTVDKRTPENSIKWERPGGVSRVV